MNRAYQILSYLCCALLTWSLTNMSHAATVKRANVAGTLFLLSLQEEEKFGSGDIVFIIIEGQMKTTGTVKIESDGNVYLKPKTPITDLKQGDEILISHDPIWLMNNQGKSQIVSGTIGSTSGNNVFIKMEERFHPVFALNQTVEIQVEETLIVIPASAIEYRKTGIWFKVTGDVAKLPSGTIVSFPHTQTAGRSVAVISRRLRQGTSSALYRIGRNALSIGEVQQNYSGYAAGIIGTHEVKSSKYFSMIIGAGAEYQSMKSTGTVAGVSVDYDVTQFSAVFHASPQYRLDERTKIGAFGELQYGLNGSSNSKTKSESNSYNTQMTSGIAGLTGSYMIGSNSVLGLFLGFSSVKLTVTSDTGSNSYNGNGNSQLFYFATLF